MTDASSSTGPEMSPVSVPPASGDKGTAAAAQSATPNQGQTPRLSPAARGFDFFAVAAPLFLIVLWLIRTLPNMLGRHAHGAYGVADQLWNAFALPLPGDAALSATFSTVQPVYPLFLDAIARLGGTLTALFPGLANIPAAERLASEGAILSGLLLLLLTWGLALVAGYGRRAALAAGCSLLIMLSLAGLPAAGGENLLSGAILTASLICLCSGWANPFAPLRLCAGFALAALATLSAGLPGLALPLLASLFFLLWRGNFRRGGGLDGVLGFGLLLVLLLGRAAWLFLWAGPEGRESLRLFIDSGFLAPLALAWESRGSGWWLVFPLLLALWLPFPLLLPFLHWEKLAALPKAFLKNRTDHPGHGWIWSSLFAGLLTFCLISADSPLPLLILLPPLAVLTGQGLTELAGGRSRAFFLLMSLVLLLLALLLALGGLYPLFTGAVHPALAALYAVPAPSPEALYEMLVQAALCLVFALLLWKGTNRAFPGGGLLVLTLFAACVALPLVWHAPALSTERAPRSGENSLAPEPAPVSPDAVAPAPGPDGRSGEDPDQKHPATPADMANPTDGTNGTGQTEPFAPRPIPDRTAPAPVAAPLPPATDRVAQPAQAAPNPAPEPMREAHPEQASEPALPATGQMPPVPSAGAAAR